MLLGCDDAESEFLCANPVILCVAPMIREPQKFVSRLLSAARLTREQTVIDHQAAILNYFNSRFGEFFGNCIVTNAQLQPD